MYEINDETVFHKQGNPIVYNASLLNFEGIFFACCRPRIFVGDLSPKLHIDKIWFIKNTVYNLKAVKWFRRNCFS